MSVIEMPSPPPAGVALLRSATSPQRGEVGEIDLFASVARWGRRTTPTSPRWGEVAEVNAVNPAGGGTSNLPTVGYALGLNRSTRSPKSRTSC